MRLMSPLIVALDATRALKLELVPSALILVPFLNTSPVTFIDPVTSIAYAGLLFRIPRLLFFKMIVG